METTQKQTAPKAAAPKVKKESKGFTGIKSAGIVIIICMVVAYTFYYGWLGNPIHFVNGDTNNHPIDMWGTVFKGGPIVGMIQTLLLTVIVLSFERFFAIRTAHGKGKLVTFVNDIKIALNKGDIAAKDPRRAGCAARARATLPGAPRARTPPAPADDLCTARSCRPPSNTGRHCRSAPPRAAARRSSPWVRRTPALLHCESRALARRCPAPRQ